MKCFVYCRKSQEAEDRQVMSLQSQADEIDRLVNSNPNITVIERFEEAMSAKQPGRPRFNEMMDRIERGEAECVIAWHPDRLARNAVDGGRVIHLLDQGRLKDLRFCSYTFENSPQGKFMLNIIFGYSKYYVDNLSQNVQRGLRAKIRQGWRPNMAPIGYRNCPDTGLILPDGHHFRTMERMFSLLLSGRYTVPQLHKIVVNEWGYTTPVHKSRGGRPPSRSTVYRLLTNPFYAGYLPWKGELHEGKHQPVVSKADFERAQQIIRKPDQPRPIKLTFTYGGLFHCGACGLSVTAERKRKPSGLHYTYYHCTRVHRTPKCLEPSVEEKELGRQFSAFVSSLQLPAAFIAWVRKEMAASSDKLMDASREVVKQLQRRADDLNRQIANLTDLRVRELITDEEFATRRKSLQMEVAVAEENAAKSEKEQATFEPVNILQILLSRTTDWLLVLDREAKRDLLKILCSNPVIRDKKAIFKARKPFLVLNDLAGLFHLRGDCPDVQVTSPCANIEHNDVLRGECTDVQSTSSCPDIEHKEIIETQIKVQLHKLATDLEIKAIAN